jgi:hypothetical protein
LSYRRREWGNRSWKAGVTYGSQTRIRKRMNGENGSSTHWRCWVKSAAPGQRHRQVKTHGRESNTLTQGMEARIKVKFHLPPTTSHGPCLTIPKCTISYVTSYMDGKYGLTWNSST